MNVVECSAGLYTMRLCSRVKKGSKLYLVVSPQSVRQSLRTTSLSQTERVSSHMGDSPPNISETFSTGTISGDEAFNKRDATMSREWILKAWEQIVTGTRGERADLSDPGLETVHPGASRGGPSAPVERTCSLASPIKTVQGAIPLDWQVRIGRCHPGVDRDQTCT